MKFIKITGNAIETMERIGYFFPYQVERLYKPSERSSDAPLEHQNSDIIRADLPRQPFVCIDGRHDWLEFKEKWCQATFGVEYYYQGQMTGGIAPDIVIQRFFSRMATDCDVRLYDASEDIPGIIYSQIRGNELCYRFRLTQEDRRSGVIHLNADQVTALPPNLESDVSEWHETILAIFRSHGLISACGSRFLINGDIPTENDCGLYLSTIKRLSFAYFGDDQTLCGFNLNYSPLDPGIWTLSLCNNTYAPPAMQSMVTFCRQDMIGTLQSNPLAVGEQVNSSALYEQILSEIKSESIKALFKEARIIDENGMVNIQMATCLHRYILPKGDDETGNVDATGLQKTVRSLRSLIDDNAKNKIRSPSFLRRDAGLLLTLALAVAGAVGAVLFLPGGILFSLSLGLVGLLGVLALGGMALKEYQRRIDKAQLVQKEAACLNAIKTLLEETPQSTLPAPTSSMPSTPPPTTSVTTNGLRENSIFAPETKPGIDILPARPPTPPSPLEIEGDEKNTSKIS